MTVSIDFDNFRTIDEINSIKFAYDATNPNWMLDEHHNAFFLNGTINYFQDKLQMKGIVFLNEVLERIGLQPIPEGQLYGWTEQSVEELASYSIMDFMRDDQGNTFVRFTVHTIAIKAL